MSLPLTFANKNKQLRPEGIHSLTVSGHLPIPHLAYPAVGGKDDDGRQSTLQRSVEEREALNVQHVHLVDEKNTGHELGNALVDVPGRDEKCEIRRVHPNISYRKGYMWSPQ